MCKRVAIEALDDLLKDIMNSSEIFRGKAVIFEEISGKRYQLFVLELRLKQLMLA